MIDQTSKDRLVNELGFPGSLAEAFVQSRRRCTYCGVDLLMSRQGYASAELDHLLPKSKYGGYVSDIRNLVLACRTCNSVKRNVDTLHAEEDAETMLATSRRVLIDRSRQEITKKMAKYDTDWHKATEILHAVWWQGESM